MNAKHIKMYDKIKDLPVTEALSYLEILQQNKGSNEVIKFIIDCMIIASDRRLIKEMIDVRGSDEYYTISIYSGIRSLETITELRLRKDDRLIGFEGEDEHYDDKHTFATKLRLCIDCMIKQELVYVSRLKLMDAGLLINFAETFGNKKLRHSAGSARWLATMC